MLRDYQQHAIDELRQGFAQGHRCQVLQMATGAGKTVVAGEIIRMAHEKGRKPYFIVDRLALIDQAVGHFENIGMRVGVIQGNHPQWNPRADVQVASVQTLARRRMPEFDFAIRDEVHCLHKADLRLMEEYNNVPFIGLSATPFTKGLGKYFSRLVVGATTAQLTEEGFLVPAVTYGPSTPDLSGVKTQAGDFVVSQLSQAVDKPKLIADITETWLKLGENRQTLCFATNVAHSKHIAASFQYLGIEAHHIDAYTSSERRRELIQGFREESVKMLVSVGVISVGFDAPNASCVILARPTKSLMLHIQQIGRGLRIHPGVADCLILDHSGNTQRLGFATDPLPTTLDDGKKQQSKKPERSEPLPKPCPACKFIKPPKTHACPKCGFAPEKRDDVQVGEGELVLLDGKKRNRTDSWDEKIRFYGGLKGYARKKGYKPGWAIHAYSERYGVLPWDKRLKSAPTVEPGEDVMNFVKWRAIKQRKRA